MSAGAERRAGTQGCKRYVNFRMPAFPLPILHGEKEQGRQDYSAASL
jgi:hypothetical protein